MASTPSISASIVTGGAAGIGLAIAEALAEAGYAVGIVDLNVEAAADAAERIASTFGVAAVAAGTDVAEASQNEAAFARIEGAIGAVGVLVNNAGIMPQRKGRIEDLPDGDFDRMLAIHVRGTMLWSKLVLPGMRAAGYGRIVNMSSVNALVAPPYRLGYVTAKSAIVGMTRALAMDGARDGITVNAIVPGYILTETLRERASRGLLSHDAIAERTPVGRWAQPEEIARAALFLADPESAYITGTTLVVDGGLSIRGDPGEDIGASKFL